MSCFTHFLEHSAHERAGRFADWRRNWQNVHVRTTGSARGQLRCRTERTWLSTRRQSLRCATKLHRISASLFRRPSSRGSLHPSQCCHHQMYVQFILINLSDLIAGCALTVRWPVLSRVGIFAKYMSRRSPFASQLHADKMYYRQLFHRFRFSYELCN